MNHVIPRSPPLKRSILSGQCPFVFWLGNDIHDDGNRSQCADREQSPTRRAPFFATEFFANQQSNADAKRNARSRNQSDLRKCESSFLHDYTPTSQDKPDYVRQINPSYKVLRRIGSISHSQSSNKNSIRIASSAIRPITV
jgi:hypothetical protein